MPIQVEVSYTTPNDEEFVGPFSSWRNVKTHYGAVGNGIHDDTIAIQTALNDLHDARNDGWSVLYFPEGTYKITCTLLTHRTDSNSYTGFQILGEHPATTKLLWGSTEAGHMLDLDGWYMKLGRLTFDGNGSATVAIRRFAGQSTSCAHVDLWFKNVKTGIYFDGCLKGQAEQLVQRCHFECCSSSGIAMLGSNTLDIWVWNSLFADCGFGIKCVTGGFHAYNNVFLRSTTCDIAGGLGGFFAIVDNTSIDSRCFMDGLGGGGFVGSPYIKGNEIYDPTLAGGAKGVIHTQAQPLILMDNTIASLPGAVRPVVTWAAGGPVLAVDNTYTVPGWAMQPDSDLFGAAMAFDNDVATYADGSAWGRTQDVLEGWLQYSFCYGYGPASARKVVNGYAITAASDTISDPFDGNKTPRDWELKASNDGGTWTLLHSHTGETFTSGQQKRYHIANVAAFGMYRLLVRRNNDPAPVPQGGVRIAELELLDGTTDQTGGASGLATAHYHFNHTPKHWDWGPTYASGDAYVARSALTTPTTVQLPGVPLRKDRTIFEVAPGGGAALHGPPGADVAIQEAIDSAVRAGNRAVVHIPAYSSGGAAASYRIRKTLVVPAGADIQIIGDGGKTNATSLAWAGDGDGPVLRIEGPAHCIVRDIQLNGYRGGKNDATAVHLTNADQESGEVFLECCVVDGGNDEHPGEAAFLLNGNDDTNVTAVGTSAYTFVHYGVKSVGGPKLNGGGVSRGRFANVCGAGSHSASLLSFLDVQAGAKVAHEGVYFEADRTTVQSLNLQDTRGQVAFTSTRFSSHTSDATPTFRLAGHGGELTMVGCHHVKLGSASGHWFEISGAGGATRVLVVESFGDLWSDGTKVWQDTSSPPASTAFFMSPGGDIVDKIPAVPGEQLVRDRIAFARSITARLPQPGLLSSVTAVRFYECRLVPGAGQVGLRVDGAVTP